MEYALFTTMFVGVLGGAAFLASTLTVEADRKVSRWGDGRLLWVGSCLRKWVGVGWVSGCGFVG